MSDDTQFQLRVVSRYQYSASPPEINDTISDNEKGEKAIPRPEILGCPKFYVKKCKIWNQNFPFWRNPGQKLKFWAVSAQSDSLSKIYRKILWLAYFFNQWHCWALDTMQSVLLNAWDCNQLCTITVQLVSSRCIQLVGSQRVQLVSVLQCVHNENTSVLVSN